MRHVILFYFFRTSSVGSGGGGYVARLFPFSFFPLFSRPRAGLATCMCVCVVIPFILDVTFVDVPAGVTQEEGHTGFLHLPSAVPALIFLARRIQVFLPLVDHEVEFSVLRI